MPRSISSKLFVIASGEANVYGLSYYWNFRTSSFKQVACLILKTIGKKEKNVFKIFANTKIIDFNHTCKIKHVWKSVTLGLHNTEITLIYKIKLIRYDPNGVPCFLFLNSATCICSVCMPYTYLTFIDSKVLFTSQTYILSNDPVNLELFLE